MSAGPRPRVVVVDDHRLFRAGVIAELGDAVEVVGEAEDVPSAVAAIEATLPDVVLLDVHLPGSSGREVIDALRDRGLPVRFLGLSVSDAPEDVIDLVRAGARGYVTKHIDGGELAEAIRRVADGDAVFSPHLAGFVLDAFTGTPSEPVASELDQLTPREQQVMQHLARGYAYKEIAHELAISLKTVESHASAVLRKLQLSSRHQLTRWAAQRKLL
ncbi:MAG TPA: response regulator transcription factor [Acidimicrobiales bacterium]|nr:response regulator transcription factor [Acidimicrobiales bacterium]